MSMARLLRLLVYMLLAVGVMAAGCGDARLIPTAPAAQPVGVRLPVLLFHHLAPAGTPGVAGNGAVVTVESFRKVMDWLALAGYYTPTLDEVQAFVAGRRPLPARSVLLTFDDGYESNYVYAHPLLRQHGLRAVLFNIGNRKENAGAFHPEVVTHLTWDEIREMSASGVWEIESHTYHGHDRRDGQAPLTFWSSDEVAQDAALVRQAWADHGLPAPVAVAYPFGEVGGVDALAASGLHLGFTVVPGTVTPGMDPMRLPRLAVYPDMDLDRVKALVNGVPYSALRCHMALW